MMMMILVMIIITNDDYGGDNNHGGGGDNFTWIGLCCGVWVSNVLIAHIAKLETSKNVMNSRPGFFLS